MRFSRILRDPVKFQRAENVGIVTLNRPKALNALNHPIVKMMRPQVNCLFLFTEFKPQNAEV